MLPSHLKYCLEFGKCSILCETKYRSDSVMISDMKNIMKDYEPKIYGNRKESSVLIPLIQVDGEWHILYEVRSKLVSQAGDSSFPGGKVEPGETYEEAAVRETTEELNLKRENIKVHGEMDFIIGQYMIIRCFVGEITGVEISDIYPNEEVETIYSVPVQYFLDNDPTYFSVRYNPSLDKEFEKSLGENEFERKLSNHGDKIPVYEIKHHSLWGYTANLTSRFIDIIRDGIT